MGIYKLLIASSLVFVCYAECSLADIYKYVDEYGHIHYTDKPSHSGFKRIIRSKPQKSFQLRPGTAAQFDSIIMKVAHQHKLDPSLVHAVIRAESAYDPNAVSDKGAVGLMQLMPGTAERFGVKDLKNPEQNISGGVQYLKLLLERFKSDIRLALAAYNAGENAVERYGNVVPPYPETQHYVEKVLALYQKK